MTRLPLNRLTMNRLTLNRLTLREGWTLHPIRGPIPADLPNSVEATVPGTVHTDLLQAGLIPDPYLGLNEANVQWIGESDFAYRTTFILDEDDHERAHIVAEGLDTVASVRLNGEPVAETRNQHRSYRFDVTDLVRPGHNELTVQFRSALKFAREVEERIGAKPRVGDALPYNAIRKMACNFGWDWGPTLVTAGIWRPIHLDRWSTARIAEVLPEIRVDNRRTGRVTAQVSLDRTDDDPLEIELTVRGPDLAEVSVRRPLTGRSIDLTAEIADVALWWPRGYGDQPLYELTVTVSRVDRELDTWSQKIGFRSIELDSTPDEYGTSFRIVINGQYVYVKGANWIPDDCFLPRITRADYTRGIRDAVEADMNLLRVWGGGIYESDDFYELCDREGLLVWQDFLFACAPYSEAAELWHEVEAEARENVTRLAAHPSLILWNGGNENVEGYYNWDWGKQLAPTEDWGEGYYEKLLPSIVAELDPTRPYIPSSPFNPQDPTRPTDPDHGTVHEWKVWNRLDYTHYRDTIPRFVAEFGFQGPAAFATLSRAVGRDELRWDSPAMLNRQKAIDGNTKLLTGLAPHLPQPRNFDDWHYATQLNQARAIRYAIEHYRSYSPRTGGSIVWQLNDCWPGVSWAAVDGDGRRKPLWYALRAVNAPRLLTLQPRNGQPALIAANDSPEAWLDPVLVRRVHLDGSVLAEQRIELAADSRTNQTVVLDPELFQPANPATEVIIATAAGCRPAYWYFVEDIDLALPVPDLRLDVEPVDEGYRVIVTAATFIKDLILNPDRLHPDARVDEMMITLLPGQRHEFRVHTSTGLDAQTLMTRAVLQSVNHLNHPPH